VKSVISRFFGEFFVPTYEGILLIFANGKVFLLFENGQKKCPKMTCPNSPD
jgi:hypothetical protein